MRLALEAGAFVRADRLLDDLWAGAADPPQHAPVEGRAGCAGRSGDPARDRRRRRRLPARGRRRTRSTRCACCATPPPRRGGSTPATTAAPRELSAAALARFRGEVLPAAGDWAAPHRARLEEARVAAARDPARGAAARSATASIGELEAAVAAHPYQERLWELLITALYRAGPPGRRARGLPAGPRAARRTSSGSSPGRGCRSSSARSSTTTRRSAPAAPAGNLPSLSAELVGRDDEIAALSELLARPAARRGRRARRHRQDGASRSRPAARSARRRRLARPARGRADGRRRPRHGDRRARRHRRRGRRCSSGSRRAGARADPRQLRARPRRGRGAGRAPARRRARRCGSCARARSRSTSTARPCSSSRRSRSPTPSSCSPAAPPGRATPGEVHELCRSLDGLPLAIELAAARTRTLSVEEIARRLDDRFSVLSDPTSRKPERRRALQGDDRLELRAAVPRRPARPVGAGHVRRRRAARGGRVRARGARRAARRRRSTWSGGSRAARW